MSEQKVYVGNGKQIDTQYGKLLKLSFSRADLVTLTNHLNEKGYVNINCNERKSVSEWGHTHSMQIDDWQPNQQGQAPQQQNQQQNQGLPPSSYNPAMDPQNQGLGPKVEHVANNPDNFDDSIPF
jgi:hypothetical protein